MKKLFSLNKSEDAPQSARRSNIGTEDDDRNRVLYARIISYMNERKPYLDGDFTLDDLARKVLSGRNSVSRAIAYCSGRNFKQFLNWYRVQYAKELIRQDPRMKMSEVAHLSGFNTQPSFNLAFRLNTSTTPTQWRA